MTDQTAARDAMSSLLGARALRNAGTQMYEGVGTTLPFEARSAVCAWLDRLADGVEGRARAATVRDAACQAAGQPAHVCACSHPQARHNTACSHCPCVGYAATWPRQAAGQTPTTKAASLRDRIRRAFCEASGFAWDSDMLEPDEYGDHADAVLQVIGEEFPLRQEFTDPTTADDPTPLRWGLGDVLWSDDDTVIVCLSGPDREPYWLELDPERATALRDDLAGPDREEPAEAQPADRAAILREVAAMFEAEVNDCPAVAGCPPCDVRSAFATRLRRMADEETH
ncbi:hypothetical protein ACH44C_33505 [Streptomyces purpureus]|uniref:hypothetical protein n=1 Tax=Streptomyces purpureus TaxID=1951 RepID=UPI0037AEFD59